MGIWVSWIDILNVRYLALWPLRRFALKLFVNSCERDSDRPRHPLLPFSLLPFPPLSSLSLSAATLTLTGTPPRPLAPEYSWYQWGSTSEGDRRHQEQEISNQRGAETRECDEGLKHGIMGSPEPYGALLSRWKWVVQQLGDVADIVQPCQQPSYWSLTAATCPPIGQLCVVSMELWGRHMGRHCVVDKMLSYLGPDFPLFHDRMVIKLISIYHRYTK